jgi:hypothetical protein
MIALGCQKPLTRRPESLTWVKRIDDNGSDAALDNVDVIDRRVIELLFVSNNNIYVIILAIYN